MTPYENLANAIIVMAYKDYIRYYKRIQRLEAVDILLMSEKSKAKHKKKLKKANSAFDDVIDFFYSPMYRMLTSLDPQIILDKLEIEVSKL